MAWETRSGIGSYYTRSSRSHGRVIRHYHGAGEKGNAAAAEDAARRRSKAKARDKNARYFEQRASDEKALATLDDLTNAYATAVLEAWGYYLHRNVEWRRRREP